MGGICCRTMPGPLSITVTRKRVAWLGGGGGSPLGGTTSTCTDTSGRMPASSAASKALSTASLTQVRSAFRGLSKPRRCRFLVKNSDTEISRCRAPISAAEAGAGAFGADGRGSACTNVISPFDTKSRLAGPPLYIAGPPASGGIAPRERLPRRPARAARASARRLPVQPSPEVAEAVDCLARAEVLQLEQLAHLDLGVLALPGG